MASADIQAKVSAQLARAVIKTGSPTSKKVYLVKKAVTGKTALSAGTTSTSNIELKNAVFKSYYATSPDDNILAGDRALMCDSTVEIKQGDTISQGTKRYIIINIDVKAPAYDVLAYIAQVRLK
jgi:hypothetical protein